MSLMMQKLKGLVDHWWSSEYSPWLVNLVTWVGRGVVL